MWGSGGRWWQKGRGTGKGARRPEGFPHLPPTTDHPPVFPTYHVPSATCPHIPPTTYHLPVHGFQDFLQEELFRQRSLDRKTLINHGLRNSVDAIPGCPIGELRGLDGVSADVVILQGELIGQAHGPRTVRSRGSDEHFEVERLGQLGELVSTRGKEA